MIQTRIGNATIQHPKISGVEERVLRNSAKNIANVSPSESRVLLRIKRYADTYGGKLVVASSVFRTSVLESDSDLIDLVDKMEAEVRMQLRKWKRGRF